MNFRSLGLSTVCRVTALSAAALLAATSAASAGTLFFDPNSTTAGSAGDGPWDNVTPNWTTLQAGTAATINYIPGSDAVFAANTNAVATAQTTTLVGTQFANSVNFNNAGIPTLIGSTSPSLVLGLGGLVVGAGASNQGARGAVTLDATLGFITLAGSQNWSNNSSSTGLNALVVNAGVQGSGPGLTTLSISGQPSGAGGSTTFNGALSDGAGGGRLGLTINTAGNVTTTLTGASTFSGPLTLNSGALTINTNTGSFNSAVAASFNGTLNVNFNNVGATAGTSRALAAANFNQGEGGVITVQTAAGQDVSVILGSSRRAAGAIGNFNVAGTPSATNGIAITGQATGFMNQGLFFNGAVGGGGQNGQYAYYDATLGSVRGINYGVDANTVTNAGGTTVAGGNVFVQITGAVTAQATDTFNTLNLSGASNLTLDVGATLTLSNGGLLKTGNNAATISGGAGITAGAAELVIKNDQAADALTISTAILASSTGGLTKGGLGTLTLSSTGNAYSGATTINQGTLTLGASNVIPDASDVRIVGAQNTVTATGSGGFLNIGANTETVGRVTLDGGGITGAAGGVLTGTAYDLRRGVVTGLLGGTAGLTKNGLGTVLLNNANAGPLTTQPYTGATTVNAGLLTVNSTSTVPGISNASALVLGGGTLTPVSITASVANPIAFASTTINQGDSTLNPVRSGSSSTLSTALNAITRNAGGTFNVQTGTSVTTTTTNTATASGILGGYATANLVEFARLNGTSVTTGAAYANTPTPTNATNLDVTASVALNPDVTTGTIRFNSNVATPTVTLSGTLNVVDSGGILATANTQGNAPLITGATGLTSGNGTDLIIHDYNPAAPLTIASNIVDNGATPIGMTKTGPGTVILSGANTFTGTVYLNNGVVQLGSAGALNNTAAPNAVSFGSASGFLANGGTNAQANSFSTPTLRVAGNNAAVASLSTANAYVGNPIVENASTTSATLTVGAAAGTTTYGGTIQNGTPSTGTAAPLSVVKTGASTQVLSAANTYSGGTIVNGGVLGGAADGALGTGNVTINAGGRLTLSTGVTNNYIADTATLSVANTAVVVLNFTGIPDKVGGLVLNGVAQPNGIYSASTSGGFFSGTGSVMVVAVPEPSTWVMMLGGIGALTVYLRARSKGRKMA